MRFVCRVSSSLAVLVLLGVGCGAATTVSGPSSGAPLGRGGDCDNPYYPLNEGHSITYGMITGGSRSEITMTVTAATAKSATLSYDIAGVKATQEITCTSGSLVARGNVDFGAATSGMNARTETRKSSGILMPDRIVPGATWDSEMQTAATVTLPGKAGAALGGSLEVVTDIATRREAIGEEEVIVPAGTYRAMKVKNTITMTTSGGPAGKGTPFTTETTEWFVRDVGMVKSVTVGGLTMEALRVTR